MRPSQRRAPAGDSCSARTRSSPTASPVGTNGFATTRRSRSDSPAIASPLVSASRTCPSSSGASSRAASLRTECASWARASRSSMEGASTSRERLGAQRRCSAMRRRSATCSAAASVFIAVVMMPFSRSTTSIMRLRCGLHIGQKERHRPLDPLPGRRLCLSRRPASLRGGGRRAAEDGRRNPLSGESRFELTCDPADGCTQRARGEHRICRLRQDPAHRAASGSPATRVCAVHVAIGPLSRTHKLLGCDINHSRALARRQGSFTSRAPEPKGPPCTQCWLRSMSATSTASLG